MNNIAVYGFALLLLALGSSAQNLRQMCGNVCKSECSLAAQGCNLIPSLGPTCATAQAACEGICDLSCGCTFDCFDRCQGDVADCDNKPGNPVNTALCQGVGVVCVETCGPSCGFEVTSTVVKQLISLIVPSGPEA